MTFPETIPAKTQMWATYCEDRTPTFKVHTTKGLAHSAVSVKRPNIPIAIYKLDSENDQWVLYRAFEVPESCERCGGDFWVYFGVNRKYKQRYVQHSDNGTSQYDLPIICEKCYKEDYQYG